MIELKITGATAAEVVVKLNELLEIFSVVKPAIIAADTTKSNLKSVPKEKAADTTSTPGTEEITFEQLREAASTKSNADVKGLFTKYNVDRLSAVAKEKYTEFKADLDKLKNK